MSKKKNVYLRPMVITAGILFGSELEPIWEHKNCAIPPKTIQKIAKGSILLQSGPPPIRPKCQRAIGFGQNKSRFTSLLKRKTTEQRWPKISQFLGFTKGSGYAINIVRASNIGVHENEKDYLDLRSRIFTAMYSGQSIELCSDKELRGGSIKTVNLIEGGVGKGFSKALGRETKRFLDVSV